MIQIDAQKIQTACLAFLSLIAVGVLLHVTRSFMIPFVVAVFFSYLLIPVADWLERFKVPSVISNLLVLAMFMLIVAVAVLAVYGALASVAATLPAYVKKYNTLFAQAREAATGYFGKDIFSGQGNFRVEDLFSLISPGSIVTMIKEYLGTFIRLISRIVLMMLFLIFILFGRKAFIHKALDFFHARQEEEADPTFEMIRSISRQIMTYMRLKTIISIGTGGIFGLAAWGFGLDFAFIWAFLGFVLNFIPTVGPIIATVPAIFIAILQFDNPGWILLTSIVLSGIQFSSGSFVEPKIMGEGLNLNMIAILLSLMLWGLIWGFPGMVLAVPITATVSIVLSNIPALKDFSILFSR